MPARFEAVQWCRGWSARAGNPEGLTKIHLREPGAMVTVCGREVQRRDRLRWTPAPDEIAREGYCARCEAAS